MTGQIGDFLPRVNVRPPTYVRFMSEVGFGSDLPREVESLLRAIDRRRQAEGRGRDGAQAVDDLQQLERCIAELESLRADLLVEAADPEPRVEEFTVESADGRDRRTPRRVQIEDAVREEIAAALRWSPAHAGAMINDARQLHAYLPATLDALRKGAISARHASVLAEWSCRLSARHAIGPLAEADAKSDADRVYAQMCGAFEERVLRVARRGTVAQTRAAAKRTLASLDAAGAQERRHQQRCTRDVQIIDESDGISVLLARMSTPAARAVIESVGKEAAQIDDESLSAGERRAQALATLVLGGVAPQVRLDVVLPAMGETTAGVAVVGEDTDPFGSSAHRGESIAHLAAAMASGIGNATIGGAEVNADDLREIIADPAVAVTMRKLIADPVTGVLSGCGRTTYRVPERLREFIVRRDGTCRFPGCGRSALNSQIDHAEAWDDGGSTDPGNLGALCTRHHQLKTHGGWQLEDSRTDGSCTWLSPQGRRYRHRADSLIEVTLQQQFAHVVGAALSAGHPPGHGIFHPPESVGAIRVEYAFAASRGQPESRGHPEVRIQREPDPPF